MKRRVCAVALAFAVLAFAGFARGAVAENADDPLRLVPPDASVLVGIDWRGIASSPTGQAIEQQVRQAMNTPGTPSLGAGMLDWFQALVGQVDSLVFAMPAGASADPKGGVPLLVIRGKFNLAELRKTTAKNARPEVYRSVELYRSKGAESPFYRVAYPDVNTILMGDRKYVHGAIDRWYQASNTPPSDVVERARAIRRGGQIWVSANLSQEMLDEARKSNPAAAALVSELETVDGVVSLENGLGVAMHLGAKSEESAGKLLGVVQSALALMGPGQDAKTAEMMKKLQVTRESTLVKVAITLSQEEMDQAMQTRMQAAGSAPGTARAGSSSRVAGAATRATASPARTPAAAPAPKNAKIRIYGLDEGTVEIPLVRPAPQP
jgi:hypothetical protein